MREQSIKMDKLFHGGIMMKIARFVLLILVLVAITATVVPTAFAQCAGQDGTQGCLISGCVYGNTSNARPDGNGVISSWAPGPWACDYSDGNGCAGPTNPGSSVGDFAAPIRSGGQGNPDFANGNDQDIDFSNP
jgi:hypothetical protein